MATQSYTSAACTIKGLPGVLALTGFMCCMMYLCALLAHHEYEQHLPFKLEKSLRRLPLDCQHGSRMTHADLAFCSTLPLYLVSRT